MLKSASFSWIAPVIKTNTKTKVHKTVTPSIIAQPAARRGSAPLRRSWFAALPMQRVFAAMVPLASVTIVLAIVSLVGIRLYSVNSYTAKGFEMKRVQTAIADKVDEQKKLLKQQSMLNATVTLADVEDSGMVPITNQEYVTSKQLTTR